MSKGYNPRPVTLLSIQISFARNSRSFCTAANNLARHDPYTPTRHDSTSGLWTLHIHTIIVCYISFILEHLVWSLKCNEKNQADCWGRGHNRSPDDWQCHGDSMKKNGQIVEEEDTTDRQMIDSAMVIWYFLFKFYSLYFWVLIHMYSCVYILAHFF